MSIIRFYFLGAVKLDAFELWEKIEDWFDDQILAKWEHCYVTFDVAGNLVHVQSSGRGWCQGGHYLQSGHYSWSGKTKLEWRYDEKTKRGVVQFPTRKSAHRWSGYLAVILFRTRYRYSHERNRWKHIWDCSSPPELLFKRERADKHRYEKGGRFFSHSPFIPQDKASQIGVPTDFYQIAKIYFDSLIEYLKMVKAKYELKR